MEFVRTEQQNGVAVVTLDDPRRRNAMSLAMAEELVDVIAGLANSEEVGPVVVTANPPAFCAGADLDDLRNATADSLRRIYAGFLAVARCTLPTIAAVNGPAAGAGPNLALACDVRVAARRARFECRFLDIGLHPGGGHTWMLSRILGPQGAAAMVMFGEPLDAEEAVRRGLAWSCCDDEALLDEAVRFAERAATAPREMVRRLKATSRGMTAVHDHVEAVEREIEPQLWSVGQPDFQERLAKLQARIKGR